VYLLTFQDINSTIFGEGEEKVRGREGKEEIT
jgi:hypothetical protein